MLQRHESRSTRACAGREIGEAYIRAAYPGSAFDLIDAPRLVPGISDPPRHWREMVA